MLLGAWQAYCRMKDLPSELEKRGVKFIDSKHRSQQIIDARATVHEMPPSLQDDIFWASASPCLMGCEPANFRTSTRACFGALFGDQTTLHAHNARQNPCMIFDL